MVAISGAQLSFLGAVYSSRSIGLGWYHSSGRSLGHLWIYCGGVLQRDVHVLYRACRIFFLRPLREGQ